MRFHKMIALSATTLSLSAIGCTPAEDLDPDPVTEPEGEQSLDIVATADAAGDFTTLLAAVEAAGLTETLQGDGPLTVFAPTDAAFAALPDGTVDALLADIPALTDILLYHVVAGEVPASEVVGMSLVQTAQGSDFKVTVDGSVYINEAMVTTTDIEASNGIIHVIDAVILPPASIAEIAASTPDFSTLVTALEAADLVGTLAGEGTFTVFAPTNAAFEALPEGTVQSLLNDIPALTEVLLYHVLGEKLPAADVVSRSSVTTLAGEDANIVVDGEVVVIAGADVVVTDIPASNGVIHIVDAVMIP